MIGSKIYKEIDMTKYLPDLIKPMKDLIVYNHNPRVGDIKTAASLGKIVVCKVSTEEEITDILDTISRLDEELKLSLQTHYCPLLNKDFEAWHIAKMGELDKKPSFWTAPPPGPVGYSVGASVDLNMTITYSNSTVTDLPENIK